MLVKYIFFCLKEADNEPANIRSWFDDHGILRRIGSVMFHLGRTLPDASY